MKATKGKGIPPPACQSVSRPSAILFSGDGLLSVCLPAAGFSSLADLVAAELFQSAKNIALTLRYVASYSQQRRRQPP
jgi:hypothetical protein